MSEVNQIVCAVIGGGAAGFFGAIAASENFAGDSEDSGKKLQVILLERGAAGLAKVKISGGGRCNVTHNCFDPRQLALRYPRGHRELIGPFSRFQPKDTINWFEGHGVELYPEEDGRMFPITNSSQTIVDCLLNSARLCDVKTSYRHTVRGIEKAENGFWIHQEGKEPLHAHYVLLATGGQRNVWEWVQLLGHRIEEPVPSLFTCNLPTSPLCELAGVSVEEVEVSLPAVGLSKKGAVVLTHWGLSGPAILRLSAWGARHLHDVDYQTDLAVDWLPNFHHEAIKMALSRLRTEAPNRFLANESPFGLPRTLWKMLLTRAQLPTELRLSRLSNKQVSDCTSVLKSDVYAMQGKSPYKEEFVTCGGVPLDEINMQTMESKLVPGLYFAGEVLNIDGETGGFNFQAAWTTGFLAGKAIATRALAR